MARVLIPVVPRRYNHNPRGSSTAVVTMAGHNPFESGVSGLHRISSNPGQLAGLGGAGLGADPAPVYGPPAPGATDSGTTPINWAGIAQAVATAATPLVAAEAQRLVPSQAARIQGAAATMLPVNPQISYPKPKSKMPYVLVGVGVVGLAAAFFLMRRKK